MSWRNRSFTKADDPVDEARPGKYYLPFVAASRRYYAVAIIELETQNLAPLICVPFV